MVKKLNIFMGSISVGDGAKRHSPKFGAEKNFGVKRVSQLQSLKNQPKCGTGCSKSSAKRSLQRSPGLAFPADANCFRIRESSVRLCSVCWGGAYVTSPQSFPAVDATAFVSCASP